MKKLGSTEASGKRVQNRKVRILASSIQSRNLFSFYFISNHETDFKNNNCPQTDLLLKSPQKEEKSHEIEECRMKYRKSIGIQLAL